ncbi:MAG: aminotransferase class III-fold pyridoxal phosphate-dependent enzyme [Phycisphaeraceae bacterium]|nr:aminotransferase class III-fold pyridoxal phosphate-dependent enzyme [Phycisphaeraceae bacterium]
MSALRHAVSGRRNRRFYQWCLTENLPFMVDVGGSAGAYLKTVEGQRILDFAGYYGSKFIGHNHPGLYEKGYVKKLVRAANNKVPNPDFLTPECYEFYRLVYGLPPAAMRGSTQREVYAVNSGAEAVENMLKYLIAKHNEIVGRTDRLERRRFICFRGGFHGRTVFALSITNVASRVTVGDFHPLFESSLLVDFPSACFSGAGEDAMARYNAATSEKSLAQVRRHLRKHEAEIVAAIIEPIQGAGGHNLAVDDFYAQLSELGQRHQVFMGFDEVQTGMGGSGKLYYVDHLKLARPPQAVAVAKKMGVGVVHMLERLKSVGVLDSTWGGPLVDMVRFVQEWKIAKREKLIAAAAGKGELLRRGLLALEERYPDCVFNVRGRGLLQGFTVLPNDDGRARDRLVERLLEERLVLVLGAGKASVRLRPNLSTTEEEIAKILELLARGIRDFQKSRPRGEARQALAQRRGPLERLMAQA